MSRIAFVDIGDPGAPAGSPAWCKYAHGILCSSKRRTTSEVSSLKYALIEFKKFERWRQLTDDKGEPFPSWEDYVQYPEPNGLGMPPASAKLVIEELDDSRLLGDVLGEREIGVKGGKAGPGRGKKTPCSASRFPSYGTAEYWLARLDRDGHKALAAKVRAGEMSANAASKAADYRKPPSPLKQLRKAWKAATPDERAEFLAEISAGNAGNAGSAERPERGAA